ncbi:hypothetical protein COY87_05455 [Candidatus Roizmanbacteria bacterium CG_4_10_14_0_8_um_filter_33_9]|uniref:Uncharacterized protein n=1 Tax=Candidatus Roizmanbacteria bacterium CG_4_10_14_0_8_um_filter_33_9 TaxID=1974826 RepID=A0A2M7QGX5_9BACT|nr:MAG: hypothetical protein COY87_05455 [Candidatus Roizmanbacteria bacterium CG_4_10_14_0_8_um_filter_33_9]
MQFNKSLDHSNKTKGNNLKIYKAKINWNNLPRLTAYLHDKEAIEPYGERKQQEILYQLILKESIKQKESRFLLSEEILGEYTAYIEDFRQYNHGKSPVRHIKFLSTILILKDLNILNIIQSSFHFDAQPRTIKAQTEFTFSFITNPYKICRPSAHCLLLIEFIKNKNQVEKFSENNKKTIKLSIPITSNWLLTEYEFYSYLLYKNKLVFNFRRLKSNNYLYFKQLCLNYGKKISYEEMYKMGSEIKDKTNPKHWVTNASVRRTINKLKESFKDKGIKQIHINTKECLMLTISL